MISTSKISEYHFKNMNTTIMNQYSDNTTTCIIRDGTDCAISGGTNGDLSEGEWMTLLRQLVPIGSVEDGTETEQDFQILEGAIGYIEQLTFILKNTYCGMDKHNNL